MLPTDMKRLREPEDEIRTDWWACAVIRFDPCTYRYRFRLPDQTAIEHRIKEIFQTRVRFGYRRGHVLPRREGWEINAKKTYHIYKELGMQLRNKTPKRRVTAKLREDRKDAVRPNDVWAMDCVHDHLATGCKIRILTDVDTFLRYVSALDAKFNFKREDVVTTLDRICRQVGFPKTIRVDNGSEFISRDMDLWVYQRNETLDLSHFGKPADNAYIETFDGKSRAERMNAYWFMGLEDMAEKLGAWPLPLIAAQSTAGQW